MRTLGHVIIWIIYTVLIMAIFPSYLIGWPVEWTIAKVKKQKPSFWWWKLGDWIETKLPPYSLSKMSIPK